MLKKFTLDKREGVAEFSLRSNCKRHTLYAGESVTLTVTPADFSTFKSLAAMGIIVSDVDPSAPFPVSPSVEARLRRTKEVPVVETPAPVVEAPVEEVVVEEPVVEEAPVVEERPTVEELIKKNNLTALLAMAADLGIEVPEKTTKRQVAQLIVNR